MPSANAKLSEERVESDGGGVTGAEGLRKNPRGLIKEKKEKL